MSWKLSRFRANDQVEVRSAAEILATLDSRGSLQGMPFMPEMLQYCGKRFRVEAVAHKTCDMIGQPGTSRRLDSTVHLTNLRCDGSAHGGCEAECNLFWKDAWLKPVTEQSAAKQTGGCSEAELNAATLSPASQSGDEPRYECQATQMYVATTPLDWRDPRQYFYDVLTGNRRFGHVVGVLFLAWLRWTLPRVPFGYLIFKAFHDSMHLRLVGRPSPALHAQVPDGAPTPTGRLGLKAGEYVRIKSQAEIEKTLNKSGKNRGLSFDPEEMAKFCGSVVRVRKPVIKIIDERAGGGKMLHMKEPCIMLDGVVCKSEFAHCRLNCPRAFPSYWREIWLERVESSELASQQVV